MLAPHGVALERRGGGYRIGLGRAVLDSRVFEALVDEAAQASAGGDDSRAAALAKEALGLWRGPVLSGVPLHLDGRAEAERLSELRSRALEIRVDADLALGRDAELVGELRRLVEESPYRERLVAQLMVALYARVARRRRSRSTSGRAAPSTTISASSRARSSSVSPGRSCARNLSCGHRPGLRPPWIRG